VKGAAGGLAGDARSSSAVAAAGAPSHASPSAGAPGGGARGCSCCAEPLLPVRAPLGLPGGEGAVRLWLLVLVLLDSMSRRTRWPE
jgi:hypothetical protein